MLKVPCELLRYRKLQRYSILEQCTNCDIVFSKMATSENSENNNTTGGGITTELNDNCTAKIKLAEMKVADLKVELEKRNLDKTGVKSALIEKLKNALLEEGEDPEEYYFGVPLDATKIKSSKKKCIPEKETNGIANMSEDNTDETSVEGKVITDSEFRNAEDKMNNEVTLQLSIDEEEAQLNEDENIDITKSVDEMDLKSIEELNLPKLETLDNKSSTPEPSTIPMTPEKSPKQTSEDMQEQKLIKPQSVKSVESVSPKVLKAIGKSDKIKNANMLAKTLWVTSLPTTTRAVDLKTLFSKQGRVLSVKIVKSTKQTPCKCYGFVTMANNTDATKAIQNLHGIELNGHIISVEQTQSDANALLKKTESKVATLGSKKPPTKKESVKTAESSKQTSVENKTTSKADTKSAEAKSSEEASKVKDKTKTSLKSSKEKEPKSRSLKERDSRESLNQKSSISRSRPFSFNERPRISAFRRFGNGSYVGRSGFSSTSFRSRSDLSVYERMKEDRFRQREHFRERERREAERRHAVEASRHKFIERKQREEAFRLEREKEKLRLEREILERERTELLKLERERQLLERERLEREKEELRRQAELALSKRTLSRVGREPEPFWEDRKRPRYEEHSRFEVSRERSSLGRQVIDRHPEAFSSTKVFTPSARSEFSDLQPRREVTIRSREERRIFERSDYRDRDRRRSFSSREQERSSSARQESPRMDWKRERRTQERIVTPRSNTGQRRMTYY